MVYTVYRSEIVYNGENRDYYLTYYIICFFLIIFSILNFYIKKNIQEYLVISIISIVVSLYVIEGYLTTYNDRTYKAITGKKFDNRTKFEIYKDKKKINDQTSVIVSPDFYLYKDYEIFPFSGTSNSETIFCNENGYYFIYQSDRYGFNNPDDQWDQKEIEYLLIGDSYAQGACVNRPNDIASVLRNLTSKPVLNLGQSGNGPLIEYATLREYLQPNIKKILWLYYEGNDLYSLDNELKSKFLINYIKDLNFSQNLKLKQRQIDDLTKKTIDLKMLNIEKQSLFLKFLKLNLIRSKLNLFLPEKNRPVKTIPVQTAQPEFKKIMKLANELAIKNKSKLYFIYLPSYSRYISKYDNSGYNSVKKIVNDLNIPFIDINKEVFKKESNPLDLFPFSVKILLNSHYNVKGYKKVAEIIYKYSNN